MRAIHWVVYRPATVTHTLAKRVILIQLKDNISRILWNIWSSLHTDLLVHFIHVLFPSCFFQGPNSKSKVHYKHRSWSSGTNAEAQFPFGFAKDCTSSREKVWFVALFWRWVWHPLGDWSHVILFRILIWDRARFHQSLRNFQGWSCHHVVKLGVLFQHAAWKGGDWLIRDSNGDTLQWIQTWNVTVISVCVCAFAFCVIFRELPLSMWYDDYDHQLWWDSGILSA